jgi:hypothetical protein
MGVPQGVILFLIELFIMFLIFIFQQFIFWNITKFLK